MKALETLIERKEDLRSIYKHYGRGYQLVKAVEEMAELTKEICKEKLMNGVPQLFEEELVDVLITCYQLALEVSAPRLVDLINMKLNRTLERIKA